MPRILAQAKTEAMAHNSRGDGRASGLYFVHVFRTLAEENIGHHPRWRLSVKQEKWGFEAIVVEKRRARGGSKSVNKDLGDEVLGELLSKVEADMTGKGLID